MFAVTGTWAMDGRMVERQDEMLAALVAGVIQNEGFVRGFCNEFRNKHENQQGTRKPHRKALSSWHPASLSAGETRPIALNEETSD